MSKRSQHVPIIFLTAFFLEEKDILQGYDVGAVDYLTKPINPKILKSKVGVFVDLFHTTRALTKANNALESEVQQRQRAEGALKEANAQLESRVEDRTADLTRANDELSGSEERYRQLIRSLPAAVYTTDAQGRVTLFNKAAVDLWGRTPEIGRDLWCGSYKIYHPDGTPMSLDQCPMARTLKERRPIRGEEILIERPDGTRRHILPYPEPIYDASRRVIGAVNMLIDITERKKAEEAARRLAAIVEFSDDAIISKNLEGMVTSWNESARRLFGYSSEEMIGQSITRLIPPDRRHDEPGFLDSITRGEPVEHYETIRQRKDGSLIEVSLTISPIKNAEGKIIGASKIVRDITERRRTEQQLKRAHDELLAASRAKDDFLATLSHELRTPLNPILLVASDAVHNPDLAPEVRADFEMIFKNVELEARLIDDLLDLTRITRGKIALHKHSTDVRTVLQDAISTVEEDIADKQIGLSLKLNAKSHVVFADPVRLQQIFWNLLRNAAKFTPHKGSVMIETQETGDRLLVKVTDTGIGMTPEEIGGLFKVFSQGDHANHSARKFGGLGLGLAIAQKLAEFHSGEIRASSDGRGKGATFVVELPLAQMVGKEGSPGSVAPAKELTPNLAVKSALTILLVEDHEPTRTSLAHLLTRRSYTVVTASTLAEAHALADAQTFDLLISDVGLPDGNGYDLMAQLRKNGMTLRGIALTGYGMEQDIARSQEAGFIAHLTKPVRVQSLEAAISAAVELGE